MKNFKQKSIVVAVATVLSAQVSNVSLAIPAPPMAPSIADAGSEVALIKRAGAAAMRAVAQRITAQETVPYAIGNLIPPQAFFGRETGLGGELDPFVAPDSEAASVAAQTMDAARAADEQKANTAMSFSGTIRYAVSSGQTTIFFDRINNDTSNTTSGSLKLRLIATGAPVSGPATFTGYKLFESAVFGPLQPNRYLTGSVSGAYLGDPPSGTYSMVVALFEYSSSGCSVAVADNYCTVASITINSQTFGSPPPPAPPPPPPPAPTPAPAPAPAPSVVTMISDSGAQCYQNYPYTAAQQLIVAQPGVWRQYAGSTSCSSLGMSIFVGYLVGTNRVVPVFTNSASAAQILCSSGFVEACAAPTPPAPPAPPPGPTPAPATNGYQTIMVDLNTYPFCYQYVRPTMASVLTSLGNTNTYSGTTTCPSLGFRVYAGRWSQDTVSWVFDSSAAFAQIDCDVGIAVQCNIGNPPASPPPPIASPTPAPAPTPAPPPASSGSIASGQIWVIEYYIISLNKYFITGRAAEQSLLDSFPTVYRRTGAKFAAYPAISVPVSQQAVCRFYLPAERGGPNSHFYGLPTDCNLVRYTGNPMFVYEGEDFAVAQPTAGGTCPASAPYPVYRSFNNRAAQNDGNHRYTVTTSRYTQMTTRGWSGEGPVFCVSANVEGTE